MPELLTDNVPSCQHLLFVPEIIQNIEACDELVGPHAPSDLAVSLDL